MYMGMKISGSVSAVMVSAFSIILSGCFISPDATWEDGKLKMQMRGCQSSSTTSREEGVGDCVFGCLAALPSPASDPTGSKTNETLVYCFACYDISDSRDDFYEKCGQ